MEKALKKHAPIFVLPTNVAFPTVVNLQKER